MYDILPQSWIECEFENICNIYTGNSINEKEKSEKYVGLTEGYNYIATKDISNEQEINYKNGIKIPFENQKFRVAPAHTTLLCIEGGSAGRKIGFTNEDVCFVNKLCAFVPYSNNISSKYVYYYLQSKKYANRFNLNKSGLIGGVSISKLKMINIDLAPLNEQKRIVEKIEEEFAKIDEGIEKLNLTQEQIKQYKQSVLKSAFEGKLTQTFNSRSQNDVDNLIKHIANEKELLIKNKVIQKAKDINEFNVEHIKNLIPKKWKWIKLNDIAFVTKLAGFEYTKYINLEDDGEVPVIRAQNVRTYHLDESSLKYINMKTSQMLERSALTKKCILMTFIGAGIGDTALFDKETRYHLAPNVAKIELFNNNAYKISDEYVAYYLLSAVGKSEIFKSLKATAQPSLSMGTIRDIYIPLCILDEQKQIVKEIEKRFEVANNAEKVVVENLEKAQQLKQAILKKAFEGRLVPQDPNDEPASVLLEKIKAERGK